eukprot:TRINITY_DN496_c0_g1_i2.p1 TRINITY_DN496_c0_g1~~TRINITY_DN496_c0_g1_i2.p1  ORF type:complete len:331 (+),score=114.54 TRINITY_DN496_c0_g1_i2:56-1048(+)
MLKIAAMMLLVPCTMGMDARAQFEQFKTDFNKVYKSKAEEQVRFLNFKESLRRVEASGNKAHGVTQFSDMTTMEFSKLYLGAKGGAGAPKTTATWDGKCTACDRFPEAKANATSWDWTTKGAVTHIKNQGQCGSCWSFGTTGDIEGTWFLAGHTLTALSEQELVSCDKVTDGCDGGWPKDAMKFVVQKGGLVTEGTYPYTSGDGVTGNCKETKTTPVAASIKNYYQVSSSAAGEANILQQLPQVGPIAIVINATPMQDYRGGIDNPRNCPGQMKDLDHVVLIVGFGEENGTKYWKIKNSWGASWGEEGFYRIVRGENKCGLAMDAIHSTQ